MKERLAAIVRRASGEDAVRLATDLAEAQGALENSRTVTEEIVRTFSEST